jgi:WhiB family transcriptional regulator, redox-sensing transcriptional regulator
MMHMHRRPRPAPSTVDASDEDWRHRAACRSEDPELFFPVGNTRQALLQIAKAKAICAGCPVASQCLDWALKSGQDAGMWGGMSEDERRVLERKALRRRDAVHRRARFAAMSENEKAQYRAQRAAAARRQRAARSARNKGAA